MPQLRDPVIRGMIEHALSLWKVKGYVNLVRQGQAGVEKFLPEFDPDDVLARLCDHVRRGGRIGQVEETASHLEAGFRYEVVMEIGSHREMFFEMLLNDRDPTDPVINIVSVHPSTPR